MIAINSQLNQNDRYQKTKIKCVVWDLDNTIWDGILLEDERVDLRSGVVEIIKVLDSRGILQSIASKNNYDRVIAKLENFELSEFFLIPQINWNSKASSIEKIAKIINIGTDAIAFIDDQLFELEEVSFSLPEVICIDAAHLDNLLALPEFNPRFITEDSKNRRQMYIKDLERKKAESEFVGPQEEFLATLNMHLTIASARQEDLQRAEELTVRTNQLNSTGNTYSYEELDEFRNSKNYKLLIASLDDKYGSYGKIGLALLECNSQFWTVDLLLMSCRVMSRGVGSIMLNHILQLAKDNNVTLRAKFLFNDRNRLMYISYKFAGFKEIEKRGDLVILENDLKRIQLLPKYIKLSIA